MSQQYTRQQRKDMRRASRALREYGNSLTGENMSSSKAQSASGGVGFGTLLFLLFLGLKLGHVINWSWLWVFAPLWIPFAIVVVFVLVGVVVAVLFRNK